MKPSTKDRLGRLILWNLCAVFGVLGLIEVGGRFYRRAYGAPSPRKDRLLEILARAPYSNEVATALWHTTGFGLSPASVSRHKVAYDGTPSFDVRYTIDPIGRRKTIAVGKKGTSDRFLAVMGCSFTFGEGVEDHETLPSQIAKRVPTMEVYNYGIRGAGPNSTLARMQAFPMKEEIPYKSGTVVHLAADFQVERVLGTSSYLAWDTALAPHFELTDTGDVVNRGSWKKSSPIRYALLRTWGMHAPSSFLLNRISLPPYLFSRGETWRLMAGVFLAMKQNVAAQFPGADFVVVLYPRVSSQLKTHLVPLLNLAGVKTLDAGDAFVNIEDSKLLLSGDGHPSAYAHAVLAGYLIQKLDL